MKRFLLIPLVSLFLTTAYAADTGITISLGQPGFYGQVDLGDYPPPRLVYAEPVIVEHAVVVGQPIYLRAQPDHVKHWDKHCSEYHACGQRVYFIEVSWYEEVYVMDYQKKHGKAKKKSHKKHGKEGHDKQH